MKARGGAVLLLLQLALVVVVPISVATAKIPKVESALSFMIASGDAYSLLAFSFLAWWEEEE